MKIYADTAFLVSLHVRDVNTPAALARMRRQTAPLPWTWLHELEFRNAMRLRVFRKEMEPDLLSLVLDQQRADVESGTYLFTSPPWSEVVRESERLSAIFTKTLGSRSLDVLHVSQAVVLGVKEFLTFDIRQSALAKAAGLKAPDL